MTATFTLPVPSEAEERVSRWERARQRACAQLDGEVGPATLRPKHFRNVFLDQVEAARRDGTLQEHARREEVAAEKVVIAARVIALDISDGTGKDAFPSRRWIADALGCSTRTVTRMLSVLRRLGMIATRQIRLTYNDEEGEVRWRGSVNMLRFLIAPTYRHIAGLPHHTGWTEPQAAALRRDQPADAPVYDEEELTERVTAEHEAARVSPGAVSSPLVDKVARLRGRYSAPD